MRRLNARLSCVDEPVTGGSISLASVVWSGHTIFTGMASAACVALALWWFGRSWEHVHFEKD